MTTHSLTVAVPPDLYERLRLRAERTRRSVEDEVVLALAATLPADAQFPADLAATLDSLSALDDDTLQDLARTRVDAEDAARLAELAGQRQRQGLTSAELQEAAALSDRHDRVLVVRAEAAALLKGRGHEVDALLRGA